MKPKGKRMTLLDEVAAHRLEFHTFAENVATVLGALAKSQGEICLMVGKINAQAAPPTPTAPPQWNAEQQNRWADRAVEIVVAAVTDAEQATGHQLSGEWPRGRGPEICNDWPEDAKQRFIVALYEQLEVGDDMELRMCPTMTRTARPWHHLSDVSHWVVEVVRILETAR